MRLPRRPLAGLRLFPIDRLRTVKQVPVVPAERAATAAAWRRGTAAGRQDAENARHSGWRSPEARGGTATAGRPDQPVGRHTPEYVATNEHVGMYPMGGARRVTGDRMER